MKVDEAIKFCKKKQENIKLRTEPETFLYIEVMLKELKELRSCVKSSAFVDGYNKAIDDFAKKIAQRLPDAIYPRDYESMTNLVNEIAEVMKGGKE